MEERRERIEERGMVVEGFEIDREPIYLHRESDRLLIGATDLLLEQRSPLGASQLCNVTALPLNLTPKIEEDLQSDPPSPILGEGAGG